MIALTPWVGPVLGGIIAGLLHTVLGPDHLTTIATLSACQGASAFWFGVQWAGGHVGGMAVICLVFSILNATMGGVSLDAYEHYADYMVGLLLIASGLYFLSQSEKRLSREWKATHKSCSCHSNVMGAEADEGTALAPGRQHQHGSAWSMHDLSAMLIGFVQGCACPAGLVGIIFLKHYAIFEMCIFVCVFLVATTLAMGSLAASFGMATKYFASDSLSRVIYFTSCALSITLGLAWIILNATVGLEAAFGHHHDHPGHSAHDHGAHGAHGHDHGGVDDDHLREEMSSARFLFLLTAPR